MQRLIPMPERKALVEKRIHPVLRKKAHTPYSPMHSKPIEKREKEHNCAEHSDSRTNMHNVPISIDANVAAKNALRYPLFMRLYACECANYTTC